MSRQRPSNGKTRRSSPRSNGDRQVPPSRSERGDASSERTIPPEKRLVIAISSRALFNLDEEHRTFADQGLDAYRRLQIEREEEPMAPGTAFPLAQALLAINQRGAGELVEVVLVSRNDADTGLRAMNSLESFSLPVRHAIFTDGRPPFGYLEPLECDLFLSANEEDVAHALAQGFAAALVYPRPDRLDEVADEVRIAFDGDAVLFSSEAERTYRERGLAEFHQQEHQSADVPMAPGPFKGFLDAVHHIQRQFPEAGCPLRTALVTARSAPAHKRAIKTLRSWNVRVDEAFFLGGRRKEGILRVFRPHIFFDDQTNHCEQASRSSPTARVPTMPSPPAGR